MAQRHKHESVTFQIMSIAWIVCAIAVVPLFLLTNGMTKDPIGIARIFCWFLTIIVMLSFLVGWASLLYWLGRKVGYRADLLEEKYANLNLKAVKQSNPGCEICGKPRSANFAGHSVCSACGVEKLLNTVRDQCCVCHETFLLSKLSGKKGSHKCETCR